ncbi:MAG: hypothetical protein D6679_06765 [Candidatus Hydrogenedentota bacterium]|nr:MAG: hypothetical protein D6679_06765 [Candidatus Hydrogenedentota bacterium]
MDKAWETIENMAGMGRMESVHEMKRIRERMDRADSSGHRAALRTSDSSFFQELSRFADSWIAACIVADWTTRRKQQPFPAPTWFQKPLYRKDPYFREAVQIYEQARTA